MTAPESPPPTPPARWQLSLLASLFLTLVVVIVWQRHAILVPLYVGLLAWAKTLFKALTPKLLLLFVKNGLFIKSRQLATALFTQFFVFSHRPWRRRLATFKGVLSGTIGGTVRRFVESPLWFRAAVALVVLALTATSAYAFVALLIIPKPIMDWLKARALAFLNKLGVTRSLDTLWRQATPGSMRRRWHLFAKWRLGRHQVLTSRRFHQRVERRLKRGRAVPFARFPRLARRGVGPGSVTVSVPPDDPHLAADVRSDETARDWVDGLPRRIAVLRERWSVVALVPLGEDGHDGTGSWVAGCRLADGTEAVLKLGRPHLEGRDEIAGLRFWDGEPTVRLLASDADANAMLLERCVPGTAARSLPETAQDGIVAASLRRLHRRPGSAHPFRPLAVQIAHWCGTAREANAGAKDDPVLDHALTELERLAEPGRGDVVLATDLHAGNVLAATREPWLVIDPKPFVGDPAYDVTQHLLNCRARLADDPVGLTNRVAELAEVDAGRARRWLAARLVAGPDGVNESVRAVAGRLIG